jgi:hypothetical protein
VKDFATVKNLSINLAVELLIARGLNSFGYSIEEKEEEIN